MEILCLGWRNSMKKYLIILFYFLSILSYGVYDSKRLTPFSITVKGTLFTNYIHFSTSDTPNTFYIVREEL